MYVCIQLIPALEALNIDVRLKVIHLVADAGLKSVKVDFRLFPVVDVTEREMVQINKETIDGLKSPQEGRWCQRWRRRLKMRSCSDHRMGPEVVNQ